MTIPNSKQQQQQQQHAIPRFLEKFEQLMISTYSSASNFAVSRSKAFSKLSRLEQMKVCIGSAIVVFMLLNVSYNLPTTKNNHRSSCSSSSSSSTLRECSTSKQQQQQQQQQDNGIDLKSTYYHDTATNIRQWGCNITASPFIFVHMPKTAGDSIRAAIAFSATNSTRVRWDGTDDSYYPIPIISTNDGNSSTTGPVEATLCDSKMPHHRPVLQSRESADVWVCNAHTPIGQMIGCPVRYFPGRPTRYHNCYCDPLAERCDLVYTGSNFVGSELHWLPAPYLLEQWWNKEWKRKTSTTTTASSSSSSSSGEEEWAAADRIALQLERIANGAVRSLEEYTECDFPEEMQSYGGKSFPRRVIPIRGMEGSNMDPSKCNQPFEEEADVDGMIWWRSKFGHEQQHQKEQGTTFSHEKVDWSPLYASLPVARTTVVREPFSWLHSLFFWHFLSRWNPNLKCDDVALATRNSGVPHMDQLELLEWHRASNPTNRSLTLSSGWVNRFSLAYLLQLCGEDCVSRLHHGTIVSLDDLYLQAKHNLERSFAVVGLFEENNNTSTNSNNDGASKSDISNVLEMITQRMSYVKPTMGKNIHESNNDIYNIQANRHATESTPEYERCKVLFTTNTTFQLELLEHSYELQLIQKLYSVAVQVNAFQRKELTSCPRED